MPSAVETYRESVRRIETMRAEIHALGNGETVTIGGVEILHDYANRYRVREIGAAEWLYIFGSGNVVECARRGHTGPAVVQAVKLDMAAEIRARDRRRYRGHA